MSFSWVDLWQDVRYTVRLALRRPLSTVIVIGSLTLGIGLSTAVFSFLNALFLRPLPGARQPDSLIYLSSGSGAEAGRFPISYPNYEELRRRSKTLSGIAAYQTIRVGFSAGRDEAEPLSGEMISDNFFAVLGARPILGGGFSPAEWGPASAPPEVILSPSLWERSFASDPKVLGKKVLLNGRPFTVAGVGPAGFKGTTNLASADLWVPLSAFSIALPIQRLFDDRREQALRLLGRLRPGIGIAAAAAEARVVAAALAREFPSENKGLEIGVKPLVRPLDLKAGGLKAGAYLLLTMAVLLLIVCANVANMLLARALARRRELDLRIALGASRGRLWRQMLVEGAVLALAGGLCGILAARVSLKLLWRLRPPSFESGTLDLSLDAKVLAFALISTLLAGLVVSLIPALQSLRGERGRSIRRDDEPVRAGGAKLPLVQGLVALQVALCALCLAAGGIFLQGLERQLKIDPGFDTRHLLSASFNLQTVGLDEARGRLLQRRLLEKASGLPGVQGAALSEAGPMQGFRIWRDVTRVDGVEVAASGGRRAKQVGSLAVSGGYFRTLGIALEQGRDFGPSDRSEAEPVAIVNRELVRRFWSGSSPVGQAMLLDDETRPIRVVGVAANSKVMDLHESPMPIVYLPLEQRYSPRAALSVRAAGRPESLIRGLRAAIREAAPELPASDLKTASETLARALWTPRVGALLLSILGVLAFSLALFGVYGITAYAVAQRRQEIAIRLALGALPLRLVRRLVGGGIVVLLTGLVLGLGLAHLLGAWILKLSSGVRGDEAVAVGSIALLVSLVGTLANVVPAVRVVRTHPAVELRRGQ